MLGRTVKAGMILLGFLFCLSCIPLNAEDDALDLDFNNAPVVRILETIATLANKNLIVDDSVNASMSLHVKRMNWQQALQLVLTSQQLHLREEGNTWYIGSEAAMLENLKTEKEVTTAEKEGLPLMSELIPLHYADGEGLVNLISKDRALLSNQGQILWDKRTNTLLVTENAKNLSEIKSLIEQLDVPVKQIQIKARIVVVNKSALEAFGVQLDNNATNSMNLLGAVQSASINLGINNPAGTIGFGLGRIAGNTLDLELQALESLGDGKVISAPELTVADNETAKIDQGSDVPFQTSTSSGATQIQFISATLGLKVTPTLTENGEINLILQVTNNSVSSEMGPAGNVPLINTAEVATRVLVHNGETIVLGGIYSEETSHQHNQVPVLGGIPGIGWLFKNDQQSTQYSDLLIFVTPSIVNEAINTARSRV